MDAIDNYSVFGDRGGLNGLRVSEDILLQHSKVPTIDEDNNHSDLKRRVKFQLKSTTSEDEDKDSESEDDGHPAPNDDHHLNDEKPSTDSMWSKIQNWFKKNDKLSIIAIVILAIVVLVIVVYLLSNKKPQSAGIKTLTHNTARSLILGGE